MKSKWCSQEFCAQPQLQASLSQLVANFMPDDPLRLTGHTTIRRLGLT
jgi:hypothetical protein